MNLLKDIEALLRNDLPPIPKGWKTSEEVGKEFGVCHNTAKKYLAALVAARQYEAKQFVKLITGKRVKVMHFRKHG